MGIYVERSTDFILIPHEGRPELVSIKHREPNHKADSNWTWATLSKESVLEDLYSAWLATKKQAYVAFVSNAGFSGPAKDLWKACTTHSPEDVAKIAPTVAKRIGCTTDEAFEFISAMSVPLEPLPRRKEITDVAVRRIEEFLISQGRTRSHADTVYLALLNIIRMAGTDIPQSRDATKAAKGATTREHVILTRDYQSHRQYISAARIRAQLLQCYDESQGLRPSDVGRRWTADPLFAGRQKELEKLDELLAPGSGMPVSPVVIHGLTGTGKSFLALHYAATRDAFRPIYIDASMRSQVINVLTHLGLSDLALHSSPAVAGGGGPVTPSLPENGSLLLILDGVVNPRTIQGLIPRRSLCRVIITSTIPNVDDGYSRIALDSWTRSESVAYAQGLLPGHSTADLDLLANKLHDHPLAIAQAVNYCRLMTYSIPEYISRIDRTPVEILEKGEASGYQRSIVQAIRLSMAAAEEKQPLARSLLAILSYMGSSGLPEDIFSLIGLWPFVGEYPDQNEQPNTSKANRMSGVAWESRLSLSHREKFDAALEALIRLSLVRRDSTGITTHPMVRLIARNLDQSATPKEWLTAALGLLLCPIVADEEHGGGMDELTQEACRIHLEASLQIALELDVYGPGVIAAGSEVVKHLLDMHDYQSAQMYIGPLLSECVERADRGDISYHAPYSFRFFSVTAMTRLGMIDEALLLLDENMDLLISHGRDEDIVEGWLMLARVAIWAGDRTIADQALTRLLNVDDFIQENPLTRLVVMHSRTQLLWLLNRRDEAIDENRRALRLLETTPETPAHIHEAIHGDAALLARDRMDLNALLRHEHSVFSISEPASQVRSKRLGRIGMLLSLADANIDAGSLSESEEFLTQAHEEMAEWMYGHPVMGQFLGIRGRLQLHRGAPDNLAILEQSYEDLTRAIEILRPASGPAVQVLPSVLVHLALAASALHRHDEAIDAAKEAASMDQRRYGEGHPETLKDLETLYSVTLFRAACLSCR
ncbi:ATP-binding protein [Nonomuraea sp. C10]|uniref:ATP-binding protein n=1 Tax=Nonomuraea sp. C10 TaxID=2600577 RepID=UPI0011CD5CFC|nr:ATP-binding protein [Nonomuraea sp. C10]TXK35118.1 hypothetical protein FR742_38305 [Nonomuraea sp. C10]